MPYSPTQQARKNAGLCIDCGAPRRDTACTRIYCAACAEKHRTAALARYRRRKQTQSPTEAVAEAQKRSASDRARYHTRREANRCVQCGAAPPAAPRNKKTRLCNRCQKNSHARAIAARQRQRLQSRNWGDSRQGKPLPIGGAVKVGVVRVYKVGLDTGAFRALRELKKRDRAARLKKSPDGKIEIVYQVGRIVRDALRSWADLPECPTRTPSYRQMIECKFTFGADAPTVAIERHKAARDGNLSATICDLLVATAQRQTWVAKPCAPRLSAGGGNPDPWNDD